MGFYINDWLIYANQPQILNLTIMIFLLNLLSATQDIVVDGWALTMLKKENISYSAMCNSAGQAFGIFLGHVLGILLTSKSFLNKWHLLPIPTGIITLQGYLYFWGTMYIIITTLLALFKIEKYSSTESDNKNGFGIIKTYKLLFRIIKLPYIKKFAIILLTVKLGFCIEAAYKLKLINGGITKDEIASIETFIIPLRISLPFFVAKFTSQEKPLQTFFNTIPYRLIFGIIFSIVIYFTPIFVTQKGIVLYVYKVILVLVYSTHQLVMGIMMLTIMAFYAIISDPKIGGTNMTLLTTIANIGNIWSSSAALWLIDYVTFKQCSVDSTNKCLSQKNQNVCKTCKENCEVYIDGFYIVTLICTVYGLIWYYKFRTSINNLQSKNVKEWHIEMKQREIL
ncbi:Hypothetical protein CINCED_3A007861 [Cinara cedri]|nr:Hypothetical protein CINCED_3A007861 [Cinara cedri]